MKRKLICLMLVLALLPTCALATPPVQMGTPQVSVGGFYHMEDGVRFINDDTVVLDWHVDGYAAGYVLYVDYPSGQREALGRTQETSRTIRTAGLEPGVYTVHVGAIPIGGSEANAAWGEASFGIPGQAAAPTPVPTAAPTPTSAPTPYVFSDPNVEAGVRAALGRPRGELYPADLAAVEEVNFENWYVADLSDLAALTGLKSLRLGVNKTEDGQPPAGWPGHAIYLDLSPLRGLSQLESIIIVGKVMYDHDWNMMNCEVYRIRDLSPLKDLENLTFMNLLGTDIDDARGMDGLTGLTRLWLPDTNLLDITSLAALMNLEEVYLADNRVSDIGPLRGLTNLTFLDISHNSVESVDPLAGLTNLKNLYLDYNSISDITALAGLWQLERLGIGDNEVARIDALAGLTKLEELYLDNNHISDVAPLAGLTSLKTLYLYNNEIRSVSALRNLKKLEQLSLFGNDIDDFSPVAFVPRLEQ